MLDRWIIEHVAIAMREGAVRRLTDKQLDGVRVALIKQLSVLNGPDPSATVFVSPAARALLAAETATSDRPA